MADRQAAAQREDDEFRARRRSPSEAISLALSLIDFAAARHGWPLATDEVDDLAFYEAWARLKREAARQ